MITKKKLLAEINRIEKAFAEFKMNTQLKIKELEERFDSEIDTISGKQAAEMLGWTSYMKASWLKEKGIAFKQDDNGTLHISKKDMEDYINNLNKE